MPKRVLKRVLAFLAIGLIWSLVVAWVLALLPTPERSSFTLVGFRGGESWFIAKSEMFGRTRVVARRLRPDDRILDNDHRSDVGAFFTPSGAYAQFMISHEPFGSVPQPPWLDAEHRPSNQSYVDTAALGWPFRCVLGEVLGDGPQFYLVVGKAAFSAPSERAAIRYHTPGAASATDPHSGAIPFQPIWLGLGADSVIYGSAAWFLLRCCRAILRANRRRRGLCPACAYDLRADLASGCPECGWNKPPG